jgi:hypothetical protein
MTNLVSKAINIKGKRYVLVSDRVVAFNQDFPKGSIETELISKPEDQVVVFKARVYPEGQGGRMFTGYSQAKWGEGYINTTSALENAETSAVGRALAFMGIGVIDSIASVDEVKKTTYPSYKAPVKFVPKVSVTKQEMSNEEIPF